MFAQEASGQKPTTMKQTLTMTALLVNAMALIAPGAFLWTTFELNAAQMNGAVQHRDRDADRSGSGPGSGIPDRHLGR